MMTDQEFDALLMQMDKEEAMKKGVMDLDVPFPGDVNQTAGPYNPQERIPYPQQTFSRDKELRDLMMQSTLGLGDYLSNTMSTAGRSVINPARRLMGMDNLQPNPIQTGQGPVYEKAYEYAPPATALAIAAMTGNPSVAMSSLGAAGAGALTNPEDPFGAALKWGALGGAGKLGGDLGGAIISKPMEKASSLAKRISGEEITEKLFKNISENFMRSKDEAWGMVEPIFDKWGKSVKLKPDEAIGIKNLIESDKRYLSSPIKKVLGDFDKKPTLKNMQRLQSVIGQETRKLDLSKVENQGAQVIREEWRDAIIDSMLNKMEYVHPGAKKLYESFRPEYAKNVGPYESNKIIGEVSEGLTYGRTPKQLYDSIMKASQRQDIPQEHYLSKITPELKQHIDQMALYQKIPLANKFSDLLLNEKLSKMMSNASAKTKSGAKKISNIGAVGGYQAMEKGK